jgi:hypothetical protein
MRYIAACIFAEGPTDYRFLRILLRREIIEICRKSAVDLVDVGEVIERSTPKRAQGLDRSRRVFDAFSETGGAFDILYLHTDAGGDWSRSIEERIRPGSQLIQVSFQHVKCIGVVPVRETEAWALADGDAVRSAFGTTLGNDRLGIPGIPRLVESLRDPKHVLNQAYTQAVGARRGNRGRRSAQNFLEVLAETVSLDCLRRIPSFDRFSQDLTIALQELRIVE